MFWKKKEKKQEATTNPFEASSQPSSPAPSYHTQEEPQGRYGAGVRYNSAPLEAEQRNQLMGGRSESYNNNNSGRDYSSRRNEYDDEDQDEQDEEQEINGMKQQIKNVKNDSLASTRLALQKIHETEATAANTMNMLGQQSSKFFA